MSKAIAFFPWVFINEPIKIENIQLLPYERHAKPGNLPYVSQLEIDGVLSSYAQRPGKPIDKATLLEIDGWQSGMEADDRIADFFKIRNAIAFSALSQRKLFAEHFGYCNYDVYNLVIQRYQSDTVGTFAFSTRRRDGGTIQYWASDRYAFHQPHHVAGSATAVLDYPLLQAMLAFKEAHHYFAEAATEFCCANTDSNDVPEHVEVVMVKSAFEWLLQIGEKANDFSKALLGIIDDINSPPISGPLSENWKTRRPNACRPLDAWAREFCDIRGASAHGKQRPGDRFVWQPHVHLAFSSIIFPLVFKKLLAKEGLYDMVGYDQACLQGIEQYLMHNPFDFDHEIEIIHPWSEIDNRIRLQNLAAIL